MESVLQGRLESHQPPDPQPRRALGLLRSAMGKERIDRHVARQWRRSVWNIRTQLRRLVAGRRANAGASERIVICRAQYSKSGLESLSAGPEQLWSRRRVCSEPG